MRKWINKKKTKKYLSILTSYNISMTSMISTVNTLMEKEPVACDENWKPIFVNKNNERLDTINKRMNFINDHISSIFDSTMKGLMKEKEVLYSIIQIDTMIKQLPKFIKETKKY